MPRTHVPADIPIHLKNAHAPHPIYKNMARISGPFLDRIDIHFEVPAVKYKELSGENKRETSSDIRERVIRARKIQYVEFLQRSHYVTSLWEWTH
jgi:magnesium chelatase family protein